MEPSLTEQQLKKVGGYLGIRNTQQLNQVVSDETPPHVTLSEKEKQKKLEAIVIPIECDHNISAGTKHLIDLTKQSAREISLRYQERMQDLIRDYNHTKESTLLTPVIAHKMIERGYDLPQLSIYQGESAIRFLKEAGQGSAISTLGEGVLLVYDLPRPISRFWYIGGQDSWGNGSKRTKPDEIEWGHFYREITNTIWEAVGVEEFDELVFNRLNEIAEHKSGVYYYLWAVKQLHP